MDTRCFGYVPKVTLHLGGFVEHLQELSEAYLTYMYPGTTFERYACPVSQDRESCESLDGSVTRLTFTLSPWLLCVLEHQRRNPNSGVKTLFVLRRSVVPSCDSLILGAGMLHMEQPSSESVRKLSKD